MSSDTVFGPRRLHSAPTFFNLLHLCAAYDSTESHSSSFAGVSVLSASALIMLYFTLYICSTFNLLQSRSSQTIILA